MIHCECCAGQTHDGYECRGALGHTELPPPLASGWLVRGSFGGVSYTQVFTGILALEQAAAYFEALMPHPSIEVLQVDLVNPS